MYACMLPDGWVAQADVLAKIRSQEAASSFLRPVDKKIVTDYYTIVEDPMDLGRMQDRLREPVRWR